LRSSIDSATPRRKRISGSFGFFASAASISFSASALLAVRAISRWISAPSAESRRAGVEASAMAGAGTCCAAGSCAGPAPCA
jgi:hypothetical protein